MDIKKLKLIYFSATGTTQKVLESCPTGARVMEDSMWKSIASWLNENCSVRKEPEIFFGSL